jgi:hypothetical protein
MFWLNYDKSKGTDALAYWILQWMFLGFIATVVSLGILFLLRYLGF